jgi:exosortase/archaeosortase family protein
MRGWRCAALLGAPLGWLAVIVLARAGVAAPARLLTPVAESVAALVQALLGWGGLHPLRAGAWLYLPGAFGYEVGIGCTGLLPAMVLVIAILAAPAGLAEKGRGLAVGVPIVLAVNLLRLAHLFYLGVYAPRLFGPAHEVVWEAGIVLATFATWAFWFRWAMDQRRAVSRERS